MQGTVLTTATRQIAKNLQIQIPRRYQDEPILSRLVSEHHLTLSLKSAVFGSNAAGDGWFSLDLRGAEANFQTAKAYLQTLKVEIWAEQVLAEFE